MMQIKEIMKLHTDHEPYSLDLLNYEIAQSLGAQTDLPSTRFSGKRVRQSSSKLSAIKKRDRRLRKLNMSVVFFAS